MGVDVITDTVPESMNGTTKVESVTIDNNDISADTVIISTGVIPETSLAQDPTLMFFQEANAHRSMILRPASLL
jgi:thioredoxin reductase